MKTVKRLLFLTVLFSTFLSRAQDNVNFPIHPIYYSTFDPDSLKGFDESAARASAIYQGYFGSEFKQKMYNLKREYIDNKYGLLDHLPKRPTLDQYLMATRPAASPGCTNEDFEASTAGQITSSSQIAGWTITKGYNANPNLASGNNASVTAFYPGFSGGVVNSCNLITCCPIPPIHSELIDCSAPGGFIDAQIGNQYPIYSVFGTGSPNAAAAAANPQITSAMSGNKVLRLNDGVTGDYSIERLSKTFSVTAQNALFQFAFLSVFLTNHDCCDAGAFQIKLTNASANTVIPCPNFSVSAPSSACLGGAGTPDYLVAQSLNTYTPSNAQQTIYNRWKINSMDLTAYIGQNITIDIISSDCAQGGHYGKIYFDAQCGPMTVLGNGNIYDAGVNVTVPTCGASGATICAADGLGPYSWAGIGLPVGYTIPSMTNQCIVTNVSGQYTLSMQPAGSCAPITRIVNSTITPAPLLNASVLQAQCGGTTAVVTLTPSGSAANPSSLTWSPTPLSLTSNTLVGTYLIPTGNTPSVISVVASDPLGCKVTATAQIDPAPPIPTFTLVNVTNSQSITCEFPSINLDAATTYSYNNGFLDFFWASPSSTFAASPVIVTTPGIYTVTGTDLVTNCGITHTIAIGVNTVAPLSTISPPFQNITCNLTSVTNVTVTANPTVNVTHQILAPQGGTFSASSYSTTYLPGGIGNFTYCLKNDINGCVTCKEFTVTSGQGFPSFNVSSPNNFTLGCNSTSCAVISIDNGNTSLPPGGAVSYTILPPGGSTVTPSGSLSINSTYTVCAPGNYTVVTKDNTSFCETRLPISILQNTFSPNITALFERQILDCNNPKVTLRGSSLTPSVSYLWTFQNGGGPNTQQGDTITVFTNTAAPTTTLLNTYTLVITDSSSTCKSFTPVPIYQNLYRPKASVTPITSFISCLTPSVVLTNGSSTGIPPGSTFPANFPVIGFLWEGPSPQEPLSNSTTYLGMTVGIYTMTAKDLNNGCTSQTFVTIVDNRIYPDLNNPAPPPVAVLDCGATSVKVFPLVNNASPSLTYSWTTPPGSTVQGANSLTLTTNTPGEYVVTVYNTQNGCRSSADLHVINGTLTADFVADQETAFAPATFNFTNLSTSTNGNSGMNSVWNFGNGSTSTITSASALYTQGGTYTVTLFVTKGTCMESKQRVIRLDIPSVLEIPNVFTPNGDGTNDLFFLKASNLSDITIVIFDRWGHKVYEVNSLSGNVEWDGKNQFGKEAAEGTYFYTIKATGKDGKPYDKKGTISLYR